MSGWLRRLVRRGDPEPAVDPSSPDGMREAAEAAYWVADFEAAVETLEALVEAEPGDAAAWHHLGRAATWTGDRARAREAMATAARLDPERFVVPLRVAPAEFARMASEVWRSIPEEFRARMGNTMVGVEELPDPDDVEDGLDPDVLGVYEGGSALEDGEWFERILLFQRNHEAVCGTLGDLREEIRRTILHEVGHHFGMDDSELPW